MASDSLIAAKMEGKFYKLKCSVQNYDWGIRGQSSEVARLFGLNSGSEIETDRPYSEFWMGTHESGPSFLVRTGSENVSLKSWVSKNRNVLGDKVVEKWGFDLPFLFKVLSIEKASSIQAHPNKELAKRLHKLQPNLYKDANHKPEMALAVTEFEALCGFISVEELKVVVRNVPEVVELVGTADVDRVLNITDRDGEDNVKFVLKSVFTRLMSASKDMITRAISNLKNRLHKENQVRQLTEKERLLFRLEKQFPGDVGVISALFFNHVKLKPGEALYLEANEPHAYISGECVECMATSDNVVRAGLTPKHRDVQTLCTMLSYKQGYPEILRGTALNPFVIRYLPPLDEFEVDRCALPKGASVVFSEIPGPSIFLVTLGRGTAYSGSARVDAIKEGDVFFTPANSEITVTGESELQFYRAGVNSRFFYST